MFLIHDINKLSYALENLVYLVLISERGRGEGDVGSVVEFVPKMIKPLKVMKTFDKLN